MSTTEVRIQAGVVVATRIAKPVGTSEPMSSAKALELLRRLKAEGRRWTEMGYELHQQCGIQLDKDQLKALIR